LQTLFQKCICNRISSEKADFSTNLDEFLEKGIFIGFYWTFERKFCWILKGICGISITGILYYNVGKHVWADVAKELLRTG